MDQTRPKFDYEEGKVKYLMTKLTPQEKEIIKYEGGRQLCNVFFFRIIPESIAGELALFGALNLIPSIRREFGNFSTQFLRNYIRAYPKSSIYYFFAINLSVGIFNIPVWKNKLEPTFAKLFDKV